MAEIVTGTASVSLFPDWLSILWSIANIAVPIGAVWAVISLVIWHRREVRVLERIADSLDRHLEKPGDNR